MPKLQWALTCQRVITDKETNAVSYIDAVEAFAVSGFPVPFPPVCVSTLWRRERVGDALHVRLRIQDPAGKTILSYEPELPKPLPKPRHRLNVILAGAEVREPGNFHIVVEQRAGSKWKRTAILPIEVAQFPSPQKEQKKPRAKKKHVAKQRRGPT